jgi:hypothetical protein
MWTIRFFLLIISAAGPFCVKNGLVLWQSPRAAEAWPHVTGTVLVSQVSTDSRFDAPYSPHVEYEYEVNGHNYVGRRITNSDTTTSSFGSVQSQISKYVVGSTPQVYYNPEVPSNSLLDPSSAPGAPILLGVGGVFAFIGISLFILSFGPTPSTSPSESEEVRKAA